MRRDGRDGFSLRPVTIQLDYVKHPEGSVLISFGDTRVLCAATVDERVPHFLKGSGRGWVTAEYAMLPRSTDQRNMRETGRGGLSGRTQEIQRLIGRALRAVVDMTKIGERSMILDCDVIQADGGTRTASVTGAFVALVLAVDRLIKAGKLAESPLTDFLAAISVGVVDGEVLLDLDYSEDSRAEVDMNLVGTGTGKLVEIQGTAEKEPFSDNQFFEMLEIARLGIQELVELQREVVASRVDLPVLFKSLEWIQP